MREERELTRFEHSDGGPTIAIRDCERVVYHHHTLIAKERARAEAAEQLLREIAPFVPHGGYEDPKRKAGNRAGNRVRDFVDAIEERSK